MKSMDPLQYHTYEQARINRHVEHRLTRLEVLLWTLLVLSGLSFGGVRLLDSWYLLHP
jgi:hypothetical protein